MNSKLLQNGSQRTWMVVFSTGEDAAAGLLTFARDQRLSASQFTAIGAFSSAELGYFDMEKRAYLKIPVDEQVEVLSVLGDITLGEQGPQVHAHVVLGKRNGTAWGGHLLKGIVRPTLEVVVTESPAHLRRRHDSATGLPLIDPGLR